MTRASLIVLNFDGRDVLGRCVDSLLDAAGEDDEIIVVDNASTDGSLDEVPDSPRIQVLRRVSNNYIFGLNDGVAAASGRFIAFLNNDITVASDFVDECLAGFDGPGVFAVCPRILQSDGEDQGSLTSARWVRGLIFYDVHPHDDAARTTFFAVGGQSFFEAKALRRLGSIDPCLRPMYHEDIELSYRAWKAGLEVRYAAAAVVHHVGGHSTRRRFTPRQLRSFVRQNELLTVWINVTDRRLLLEHLACTPLRLLMAVVRRDWGTVIGFGRALGRIDEAWRSRRRARLTGVLSDREALRRSAGRR